MGQFDAIANNDRITVSAECAYTDGHLMSFK